VHALFPIGAPPARTATMSAPRTKKRQVRCKVQMQRFAARLVLVQGHFDRLADAVQAIVDGVFKAELNELLTRELAEDGYSGVTVRRTTARTDIIVRATRTQKVLGALPGLQGVQSDTGRRLHKPCNGSTCHQHCSNATSRWQRPWQQECGP
jgi:hypothetical protein